MPRRAAVRTLDLSPRIGSTTCGRQTQVHSLGIGHGEKTPDGRFSFEEVECLASCGTAPVLQINNGAYHESLDVEKVRALLARLATE